MNTSSPKSRFFVAMMGALIVVAATWKVRHPSDATRNEASRSMASIRTDSPKKARLETETGIRKENKVRGSFTVSIVADDGLGGAADVGAQPATRFHLLGSVTAERHIAPHDFSWIVPQNYKVIDGAATGTIPELKPGQTHEVRITVDRGNEPPQPIVLHVFKMINSEPRGQVAQFDISIAPNGKSPDPTNEKAARLRDDRYVQ